MYPVSRISTDLELEDIVLGESVRDQLSELENGLRLMRIAREERTAAGRLGPGYRALFHGPPGTGKTLAAMLLGKSTGRDVYRVDLSSVVSKYIGETQKNLAALFNQANGFESILYFDEADALFAKRADVKDAHDRYANQEVSYLLQKFKVLICV